MAEYEAVIGMETHAQLVTQSKMFCSCSANVFGAEPNTHVCPVCLGMPGALPVINRRAIEQTIMVGLALNCHIAETAVFSRKNYFYPDLPKSYQISMYDFPLCQHGWLQIDVPAGAQGAVKRIGIRRVHLEEDTAKSFHAGDHSLVDFNRSGLPLIEIVTEPDIQTPEEARQYLIKLQAVLRSLGVASGDMEKGAMRCEPNISVRPVNTTEFGTKVEIKNLNSFRSVKMALEYEIARQIQVLNAGRQVRQVTMGWDEQRARTVEQRAKEESDDYRYFPDPDLPPLHLLPAWIDEIREALPELPDARRERFVAEYGLSATDSAVLTASYDVAEFFEAAVAEGQRRGIAPQSTSNWITGEIFRLLRAENVEINAMRVTPASLAELIDLVDEGTITVNSAKVVLGEMFATGQPPGEIVQKRGLIQISDRDALIQVIDDILAANSEEVAKFRDGKESLLGWFVGQVMRATRGKANPQMVTTLLEARLRGKAE
jgi:aspartyl-tRNA(Asn)/glutamyl-tRNA(Gln) amidotransferase subunit B